MKILLNQIAFRNQTSFLAVSALNLESQVRISTKTSVQKLSEFLQKWG